MFRTMGTRCFFLILLAIFIARLAYPADPHRGFVTPGIIAFERLDRGSLTKGDVYLVRTDGSGLAALTHDRNSHHPMWSPDGKRILFIHDSVDSNPRNAWEKNIKHPNELYVMNSDGTNARLLKHLDGVIDAAAWSPDGTMLAISYVPSEWLRRRTTWRDPPVNAGLFLMDAGGNGEPRLLFRDTGTPAWSPDGKRIAFSQGAGDQMSLHVANKDGSHEVQLTGASLHPLSPALSPDGAQIAFSARTGVHEMQTFIMNSDGSHERQLTNNPAWRCMQPSWSPDGKQIVLMCVPAWPACAPGIGNGTDHFPPCSRRIFLISATDPHPTLRQVTEENGMFPQFAPRALAAREAPRR